MKTESKSERERNLADAFSVAQTHATSLSGKHVWLIDDVATTGATLDACARALKAAGAATVWGVVVSR
jgi:predicted amidophosphoribosyltransferase